MHLLACTYMPLHDPTEHGCRPAVDGLMVYVGAYDVVTYAHPDFPKCMISVAATCIKVETCVALALCIWMMNDDVTSHSAHFLSSYPRARRESIDNAKLQEPQYSGGHIICMHAAWRSRLYLKRGITTLCTIGAARSTVHQ
jgi:hypothetical protein